MANRFLILLSYVFLILTAAPMKLFAQTQETGISPDYYDVMAIIFLGVLILILFAFLRWGTEEGKDEVKQSVNIWEKVKQYLTAATPIENEKDILMDHDYDGIKELDNKIPPWFSYLFYTTIIIAVYYLLNYHVFKTGMLQAEEYKTEMQQAELLKAELENSGTFLNENNVQLLTSQDAINEGKQVFNANCVACHRADAGGAVGPNLTDNYWIHGGGIKNVFKTIKYGVPDKGMVTWQQTLTPKQIQEVASYVISLKGTNPVNPKPPQGNLYVPADSTASVDSTKIVEKN